MSEPGRTLDPAHQVRVRLAYAARLRTGRWRGEHDRCAEGARPGGRAAGRWCWLPPPVARPAPRSSPAPTTTSSSSCRGRGARCATPRRRTPPPGSPTAAGTPCSTRPASPTPRTSTSRARSRRPWPTPAWLVLSDDQASSMDGDKLRDIMLPVHRIRPRPGLDRPAGRDLQADQRLRRALAARLGRARRLQLRPRAGARGLRPDRDGRHASGPGSTCSSCAATRACYAAHRTEIAGVLSSFTVKVP